MKALSSAERDLVRSIDLERLTDDLQTLVRIRSDTGEEAAAQRELAHRMAAARLNVVQTVADPAELAADPDFPGMEVERTTLPIVAGHLGNPTSGGRRVMIAGHIDTAPQVTGQGGPPTRSVATSVTANCSDEGRRT